MLNTQFSPWPSFTEEEARAVQDVILSNKVNYWTGNECRSFEKEFAQWSNSKHAVSLGNGTLALDSAFYALNIGLQDEVIVTSRTYIASISSIVNCGAIPIFVDIDISSQNITPETISNAITKKTKAILCVHLAGWPCDMDNIMEIANKNNLYVIEDCAQAHGAKYKGRPVGSIGNIGCWSFCQDKIITTGGEGGMITTNDETLWRRIWEFKDHGKSFDAVYNRKHLNGFKWLHESFGTNWRMTEIQATIGRIQLKKMSKWHNKRFSNMKMIQNAAKECSILRVPNIPKEIDHAAYKCYVFVKGNASLRDKIIEEINKKGVPCYSGSCSEVYLEKAFQNTSFKPKNRLKNAKELGDTSLMFLVHPTLTSKEIKKTCSVLKEVAFNIIKNHNC